MIRWCDECDMEHEMDVPLPELPVVDEWLAKLKKMKKEWEKVK